MVYLKNKGMLRICFGFIILSVFILCYVNLAFGLDLDRETRLSFTHVLYVSNITSEPENFVPGTPGTLTISFINTGFDDLKDVRIKVSLPEKIAPYSDIDEKKVPYVGGGQSKQVQFSLIPSPNAEEGVYKIPLIFSYLNVLGDEREENVTFTILIRTPPKIFVELKSTEIYKGSEIGNIVVKVVNNQLANVKFLTVDLAEGDDYDILGYQRQYIGDLDSDDFQEVEFKVKVHTDEEGNSPDTINLPLTLSYADSFNKFTTEQIALPFTLRTTEELGIKKGFNWALALVVIVVLWIVYLIIKAIRKRKIKQLR
jgi:hypothetical protein